MSDFSGDQVHPATPIRLEQARREGNLAKSFELSAAVQAIAGLAVVFFALGGLATNIKNWTKQAWQPGNLSIDSVEGIAQIQTTLFWLTGLLIPILGMFWLSAVVSHLAQTGFGFRPQKSAPDLTRLSPTKWLTYNFSADGLSASILGIPKSLIAALVALLAIWIQREQFMALRELPIESLVGSMFELVLGVAAQVAGVVLLFASADFGFKLWNHHRRLRMTDQQLRDEQRTQNGAPEVSQQRRQRHRTLGHG